MAYIGNQPTDNFVTFATQNFSTSATSSYTLSHAVSNENEIALFINNVRQHPGSGKAYTASGTALTLSANTASTDVMYCIFLGRAIQSTVPATNSITTAMFSANAVTGAKLNTDVISAQTALAAEPADTDEFLVSDAGVLKRIDYSLIKGGGCWEKLDTITISGNTSQIEHEEANFTSTHRDYKIMLSNVGITADAQLRMRIAADGASLLSTTDYRYAGTAYKSNNSTGTEYDQDNTQFVIAGSTLSGGSASYSQNFEINLYHPLSTATYLHFSSVGMQMDDNDYAMTHIGGGVYVASDGTAMKRFALFLSTGDFNAGTSTLYGRVA